AVTLSFLGVFAFFAWCVIKKPNRTNRALPPLEEITKITASIHPMKGEGLLPLFVGNDPTVDISIPEKYFQSILGALEPATSLERFKWDQTPIATLTFWSGEHNLVTIRILASYQGPVCFFANDVLCIRGGGYHPVILNKEDDLEVFDDESLGLVGLILAIV